MPESPLLYYITDRTAFPGDELTRRIRLLDKIAEAACCGVDYIQLREKDMSSRDLESLAGEAVEVIRKLSNENRELKTVLLINSRTDVALASGAAGVHLRADDVSPREVRDTWHRASGVGTPFDKLRAGFALEVSPRDPVICVSCHSPEEVVKAAASKATFAVFGPVFEKKGMAGTSFAGLDALRQACSVKIPVLALGGVTLQNAESCQRTGAAGIAAIRLFQENDIATVVRELRH
jgi:thiamine-phosphate pyrophosphorylase